MATLADLLALAEDNSTEAITAADLRQIITGLWDYTENVQQALNDVVVTGLPAAQAAISDLDARVTVLEEG